MFITFNDKDGRYIRSASTIDRVIWFDNEDIIKIYTRENVCSTYRYPDAECAEMAFDCIMRQLKGEIV